MTLTTKIALMMMFHFSKTSSCSDCELLHMCKFVIVWILCDIAVEKLKAIKAILVSLAVAVSVDALCSVGLLCSIVHILELTVLS